MDSVIDALAWALPLILAVTLHEVAHGWAAWRLGDDTARVMGRLTLNPLRHIDKRWTIMVPLMLWLLHSPFIFGSAKPVPVNFNRLQPPRLGMILVAIAGPLTNVGLALISGLLLHIERFVTPEQAPWLFLCLYRSLMINCVLAAFNMLPILPLDGGRVIYAMLHGKIKMLYGKTERWGLFILIPLLLVPAYLGYDVLQQALLAPANGLLTLVMHLTGNGDSE